ncbi:MULTISPECIES: lipoprotein-releasing ABC transporter permease subunit [Shewanella]|uniref:Lipoprotein-releasing ABC transporter permease subunit n=1 Tax=Shewanella fidelis TaxID=173509 RepID=A0AAW8NPL5_9GAMM|nr:MULTISPECIES: lipoprotein-releasing ABC transporter permease subunit [Shewanella]MDR8524295.1 lipoprotein-releasing ABC transporter permease subunit [Shewanella fidelis]MDW4813496.1 lipoprotein-releasing ABC transporter permease subunit [Shewanella fidelis]MDW4817581.1 lipoprotein-releasing ABC transporter permease subunit [Shewanella fidelis]MDW4821648.1 lipoprotein-releasing ABC transporter permease subunit [Shewanella fidelis]MDW4825813.1 lipoprotein-releasing ABC transporter permease su
MNFSLSFYIGYRYWRARKANAFASFITIFAVSGILLGVAALIVVSSVMNGLEGQLKQRILGAVPQLTVHSQTPIENWQQQALKLTELQGVVGATASVATQAMLQSPSNIGAAQVYGVYPEQEKALLSATRNVYSGDFDDLVSGKYRIILGAELARMLDVAPGDKVRVLSGDGVVYTPLGPVPSQRKFTVVGVFEMGSQVDATLAYVHHDDAQRLMRQTAGQVKELRLYLDDPFNAAAIAPLVIKQFSQAVTTTDWRDTYGHLFGAVKMEKNMMSLMLSLIIAVAAFNIVSALVMMVVDKTTDVAVLKTQGLTTANVMGIFLIQGSLNAVIGLLSGLAVGVLLTLNLNSITHALGISILGAGQNLPVQLQFSQLTWIVVGTLAITLIATIYPAIRAANVQPATALRYE